MIPAIVYTDVSQVLEFCVPHYQFYWTAENEAHLAEHGVSPDEFEEVVLGTPRDDEETSRSSGLPACRGYTRGGRLLFCVYEPWPDGITVYPVTAYQIGGE